MYIVLEIQKMSETSVAVMTPIFTTASRLAAESEYHRLGSFAAVSTVPAHSIMIISDRGVLQKVETYVHPVEEQNEE